MRLAIERPILISGNIVCDVLALPVDSIPWGATVRVERIERHLGGNGANTAYTLARLSAPVVLAGATGGDEAGRFVLAKLAEAGVDLALVRRVEVPTSASVVLVARDGQRAFLHVFGASAEVDLRPLDIQNSGCGHYHLASPFGLPRLRARKAELLHSARDHGLTTSVDLHWDAKGEWMADLAPCLPFVDLLFLNEDEARMLTGTVEPPKVARICRDAGVTNVVMKMGAAGCAVFAATDEFVMPAYPVDTADTTGAGDCFVGAFLAALHRGECLRDAAKLGCAAGALSASKLGAVTGVLPLTEMLAWMRSPQKEQS